ncbi:MAG: FAD-binding oxidoreductase [Candidatus Devosia phytovorans]|uniref:FAD-binding oxidoreductase n=1 Tax=Candidatus Devosia phytovorans TaxID=3121372 RepID=A0AAJ5W032_9HYPH|nr:FAD-binding oxidoreductase [Devosia sp.]WEK06557.1 MAG: FAD-binding oxidoreductase [Devosia sp.]
MTTSSLTPAIEALASHLTGRVMIAGHPDYDLVRGLAHSNWDDQPLLVARVANAADVADVIDFTRYNKLQLAVRSGGHSVCGHSSSHGGVVIDLRDLQGIEVDLDAMTVWAGSGLTAGQLTEALDRDKVVVGFGDSGSVGIGGITLGGGIGYMTRKFGLTMDAMIAAELVTAAGDILTVTEESYPDLFWALHGGGGNFGVVTRFCYRLHALAEFTGGPLVLPPTPEALAGFVAAAEAAPDELSTILLAMPAPPLPFLPPEVIGQTVLIGMMGYAGPAADAQEALAPFRALAEPIADLVGPGPYGMMYLPEDPHMKPAVSVRSMFRDEFGIAEATTMLERLGDCDAPMRMAQVRVLGGAVSRIPADASAYAHRDAGMLVGFLAMDGTAEAAARNDLWAEDCISAMGGASRGSYVNFLGDEGEDMLKASYPGQTWQRLRRIKTFYDPTNLFSRNQNIPPA